MREMPVQDGAVDHAELEHIVEALLMVSDVPLSISKIQGAFEPGTAPDPGAIRETIRRLNDRCENRSIEIRKIGGGYRFQTKQAYAQWIRRLYAGRAPRISRAQLETLSIIAYRQPVTRGDIEAIRGVSVSSEILQRLFERGWVRQVGVREVPGRPALLGTTGEFLAYFNLASLADLPPLMEQRNFEDIAHDLDIALPPDVLLALDGSAEEAQTDLFGNREVEPGPGDGSDEHASLKDIIRQDLSGDDGFGE